MLFVLYLSVMFNLYPTDVPTVESLQADLRLSNSEVDLLSNELLNAKLVTQQGNAQFAAACIGAVAIGAVIAWKSPLGKKVRSKIASAISPVASV